MKFLYKIPTRLLLLVICIAPTITGCKKYLEVPLPIDQLSTGNVFNTKPTIISAVNGMYSAFSEGIIKANYYKITFWWSDEGEISPLPGSEIGDIISANIVPANTQLMQWVFFYRTIFRANNLIEKLPSVSTTILPDAEKKQYIAAAKYIRAAEHFTLVSSWGDIPLITTTSADENLNKPRTPANEVYNQILLQMKYTIKL